MGQFRHWRWLVVLPLTLLGIGAVWMIWSARQTLAISSAQIRHQNEILFTERPVERVTVAGVESIASAASFVDATVYQNKLWLLSADALWEYSGDGQFLHRYQAGIDLPPAPLTRLMTASLAAAGEPVLCIATQGAGLVTYDGHGFRQILPQLPGHRKLTALLPLSTGELLLGTESGGVLAWDGGGMRRYHESLRNLRVTALAGQFDNLAVGTIDHGVFFLRAGEIFNFHEKNGLPDAHILSVVISENHGFVGTAAGVAEFHAGKLERVLAEGTLSRALHFLPGLLLIGTLEEGIVEVPLAARQPRPRRIASDVSSHVPVTAFFASGNTVYALLRDGVLMREAAANEDTSQGAAWQSVLRAQEASLADHNIAALAAEESGRLWIGYFDRGLDVLASVEKAALHREDERLFCINRILPTREGAVVATANGLVFTDSTGAPRRVMGRKEGLLADHVTDVLMENGRLVVGTPAGVTFLDPGGPQSITAFHGLVNNHVYALASSGARLLAGTLGGVSVLDAGRITSSFNTANSALRHNWISALARVDNEWFAGTYGAGVFRFDGSQWSGFPDLNKGQTEGLEVNPNAMTVTPVAVYAGTLGRGLAVYHRANSRWTFQTAGLPSQNVTAVSAAGGFLYVGTDNGLVRFVERSLP